MLSLVADYETTSSSNSEEDDTDNEDTEGKKSTTHGSANAKTTTPLLLPRANLILSGGASKPSGDVFSNPYLDAEKLEIDKLQKHVKMVESENHLLQKNGRKICWNNRKGRCRFGNKCKYAHDSDLVTADGVKNEEIVDKDLKTPVNTKPSSNLEIHRNQPDAYNLTFKTRKRPGLGDNIVPGKRVIKTYNSTKNTSL